MDEDTGKYFIVDASDGPVTVTLPKEPPPGFLGLHVKREHDGVATINYGGGRIVRIGPRESIVFRAKTRPSVTLLGVVLRKARTVWSIVRRMS